MAYETFVVLLLVVADCLSIDESRRVIYDQFDGDDHLGYFIKTAKQESNPERTRQNAVELQGRGIELRTGSPRCELTKKLIVTSLEPRDGNFEDISVERAKNDTPLPLHVTSTARQECLDGYQADENGTCQKMLAPKGEKSFKLRRRKRGEQPQPKLSYADVVKFGKNRPSTIPFKADILTTTQKIPEGRQESTTTANSLKSVPPEPQGVSKPAAVAGKSAKNETTVSPTSEKAEGLLIATPASVTPAVAPVKSNEPASTTLPSAKPTGNQTLKYAAAPVTASSTSVNKVLPSAKMDTTAPVNKVAATTATPTAKPTVAAPTKPPGLAIPTILTKIPTRVKSFLGDINRAFLSGEKSSIAAEAANPNPPAAKSHEPKDLITPCPEALLSVIMNHFKPGRWSTVNSSTGACRKH